MATLTMLSSNNKKFRTLSVCLVSLAAAITAASYLLEVNSLSVTIICLIALLTSIVLQLIDGSRPAPAEQLAAPKADTPQAPPLAAAAATPREDYQIADFLTANLQLLNGELTTSVPFPRGVHPEDKDLVKVFVKRLRLAAKELHQSNLVETEQPTDIVAVHTGSVPSSVVGLARELEDQIQKGNGALRHGQESVRELRELLVESSSRLRRVRDHSRSVRDGVELVKDLSEQTNVLALNAAIQASRSGEDGLGVVAEELQRVAVRGADSGRKLEEQLDALRDDLTDTMAAITRGEQGASVTLKSHKAVESAYLLVEKTSSEIAAQAKSTNS